MTKLSTDMRNYYILCLRVHKLVFTILGLYNADNVKIFSSALTLCSDLLYRHLYYASKHQTYCLHSRCRR